MAKKRKNRYWEEDVLPMVLGWENQPGILRVASSLYISDSSHSAGVSLPVHPGEWKVTLLQVDAYGMWGIRTAQMAAVHMNDTLCTPAGADDECVGILSVDTAMACIASADSEFETMAGYGDGGYRVTARRDADGVIVAVTVHFITEVQWPDVNDERVPAVAT